MTEPGRIDLLIVEDDALAVQSFSRIFAGYGEFHIRTAIGGAEALGAIRDKMPDAIIIERCIAYSEAREEFEDGQFDPSEVNAGIQLLKKMVELQRLDDPEKNRVAIFFMHTDFFPMYTVDFDWLEKLGALFYCKPFDTLRLEVDVCNKFHIPCRLSPALLDCVSGDREQSRGWPSFFS